MMICSKLISADVASNVKDNWMVQRHRNYGFSAVAYDQAIEQTQNRDSCDGSCALLNDGFSSNVLVNSVIIW